MKDKDISSLEHTSWRCQYHIVFAPKLSKDGDIWTDKTGYRSDIEKTVSAKGRRNYRSQSMPGPYTYADKHPTQVQRITDYGVFEREK